MLVLIAWQNNWLQVRSCTSSSSFFADLFCDVRSPVKIPDLLCPVSGVNFTPSRRMDLYRRAAHATGAARIISDFIVQQVRSKRVAKIRRLHNNRGICRARAVGSSLTFCGICPMVVPSWTGPRLSLATGILPAAATVLTPTFTSSRNTETGPYWHYTAVGAAVHWHR